MPFSFRFYWESWHFQWPFSDKVYIDCAPFNFLLCVDFHQTRILISIFTIPQFTQNPQNFHWWTANTANFANLLFIEKRYLIYLDFSNKAQSVCIVKRKIWTVLISFFIHYKVNKLMGNIWRDVHQNMLINWIDCNFENVPKQRCACTMHDTIRFEYIISPQNISDRISFAKESVDSSASSDLSFQTHWNVRHIFS